MLRSASLGWPRSSVVVSGETEVVGCSIPALPDLLFLITWHYTGVEA